MSDLVRTQVLLEKSQRDEITQIARSQGKSFSELVREYLTRQLRQQKYEEMRMAAEQLQDDYAEGSSLVEMTALDREDFLNA